MTLYHGTNADIGAIDLTKGLRYKDFGKGFCLTPDKTTAVRMAQEKARLFGGSPTLIVTGKILNRYMIMTLISSEQNVHYHIF